MAFFEDSHMREPYPRDPRILFKPWYHLWQRFFWSSCVFSNFCFKWSPVKHYKSALLVDNFFQSDDFLEDFSCGNWNSNEIGKPAAHLIIIIKKSGETTNFLLCHFQSGPFKSFQDHFTSDTQNDKYKCENTKTKWWKDPGHAIFSKNRDF